MMKKLHENSHFIEICYFHSLGEGGCLISAISCFQTPLGFFFKRGGELFKTLQYIIFICLLRNKLERILFILFTGCMYGDRGSICTNEFCRLQTNWLFCCETCQEFIASAPTTSTAQTTLAERNPSSTVTGILFTSETTGLAEELSTDNQFTTLELTSSELISTTESAESAYTSASPNSFTSAPNQSETTETTRKSEDTNTNTDTTESTTVTNVTSFITTTSKACTDNFINGVPCNESIKTNGVRQCYSHGEDCCLTCSKFVNKNMPGKHFLII